jgi:hypothetical protein
MNLVLNFILVKNKYPFVVIKGVERDTQTVYALQTMESSHPFLFHCEVHRTNP